MWPRNSSFESKAVCRWSEDICPDVRRSVTVSTSGSQTGSVRPSPPHHPEDHEHLCTGSFRVSIPSVTGFTPLSGPGMVSPTTPWERSLDTKKLLDTHNVGLVSASRMIVSETTRESRESRWRGLSFSQHSPDPRPLSNPASILSVPAVVGGVLERNWDLESLFYSRPSFQPSTSWGTEVYSKNVGNRIGEGTWRVTEVMWKIGPILVSDHVYTSKFYTGSSTRTSTNIVNRRRRWLLLFLSMGYHPEGIWSLH